MKLLLLGTTGYHPNDRRHTACLMLPELGVLLDAGSAMFRVPNHLATDTLDIFLTHVHLDHVIGLTYLFDILHAGNVQQVTVHGEAEKLTALEEHLFSPLLFPIRPPFQAHVVAPRTTLRDGGVLSYFPLQHPGGSIGFRIDWPQRSLAYVTDTVASTEADYVERIRGVDLLVHECYFGDDRPAQAELTGHSCLTPVAQVAAAAGVGRLVLVHINPLLASDSDLDLDAARRIFSPIEIGADGMELEF